MTGLHFPVPLEDGWRIQSPRNPDSSRKGFKISKSPARLDAARKSFLAADGKMKDSYMVTSRYDMIAICEAPEEGSLARALP